MAEAAKSEESVQKILIPVGYKLAWYGGRMFLSDPGLEFLNFLLASCCT